MLPSSQTRTHYVFFLFVTKATMHVVTCMYPAGFSKATSLAHTDTTYLAQTSHPTITVMVG